MIVSGLSLVFDAMRMKWPTLVLAGQEKFMNSCIFSRSQPGDTHGLPKFGQFGDVRFAG